MFSNDGRAEPRPGAVGTPPQHYGNPLGEQKALLTGEAIVDLSDRAVITLTGPDRLTWLDSLTSQAVAGLQPGESAETLLLDPTGRLEHAIRLVDDGETTWLLVDSAEGIVTFLSRMVFMLRVVVTDRSADFATVGTLGTPAIDALATWVDPWEAGPGHTYAASRPDAPWSYRELVVPRTFTWQGPVAGTLALDALRIAAWRPRSTDADEKTIPHELDWLRSAVHLNKGCYRGQETVAKVHNLGHPPRRVVLLHLDGTVPAVGSAVLAPSRVDAAEASPVGYITSSALHWDLGPIALAVIKRNTDPAVDLAVQTDDGPIAAAQEIIVPTDAGATANIPRLPRLGAVSR